MKRQVLKLCVIMCMMAAVSAVADQIVECPVTKDVSIIESLPDTNYGYRNYLYLGLDAPGSVNERRMLIAWDLSAVPTTDVTITEARVVLQQWSTGYTPTPAAVGYQLTTSWDESDTFGSFADGAGGEAGVHFKTDPVIPSTTITENPFGRVAFELPVEVVEEWLTSPADPNVNAGIYFRVDPNSPGYVSLFSSEKAYQSPDDDYYSYLEVKYLPYPTNCTEALEQGYGSPLDYNGDCVVDFVDYAVIAKDWSECINPADASCSKPWLE